MSTRKETWATACALCAAILGLPAPAVAANLAFISPPKGCATFPASFQVGLYKNGKLTVPPSPVSVTLTAPGTTQTVATDGSGIATFFGVGLKTATGSQALKATATGYAAANDTLTAGASTSMPTTITFLNVGGVMGTSGSPFLVNLVEKGADGGCVSPSAYTTPTFSLLPIIGSSFAATPVPGTNGAYDVTVGMPGYNYVISAYTDGATTNSASFTVDGPHPLSLVKQAGDHQIVYPGSSLSSVAVQAFDANGIAAPGASITFSDSVASQTVTTNSYGSASAPLASPSVAGAFTVSVSGTLNGQQLTPVTFNETTEVPTKLISTSDSGPTPGHLVLESAGVPYYPTSIIAEDSNGIIIPGTPITVSSGNSLKFTTVLYTGQLSFQTFNSGPGIYVANAKVAKSLSASFTIYASYPLLKYVAGNNQSATLKSGLCTFPTPLSLLLTDAYGTALPNFVIDASISGPGELQDGSETTNLDGTFSAKLTSPQAGTSTVKFSSGYGSNTLTYTESCK